MSFLVPAMKKLMKPTQKLKPGLLPKNLIPKDKWSVSVLLYVVLLAGVFLVWCCVKSPCVLACFVAGVALLCFAAVCRLAVCVFLVGMCS